ncbi:transcriptional regulator [Nocardia mangyaensis]|uniref:Transcriptional regulator n=1 Tax=Nocardia mangyaensis TaxID=2213200 RepID=A0A1J0VPK6_9NOCA|nr:helix-turn-helix transcriptional regulator [Nocardia mangyaensis]APE33973.1 transcriptional regulator [Nocardia mangyaensis]
MKRPTSPVVMRSAKQLGEYLANWRKLQGLTAEQVAQRANITRTTLRSVENGGLGVTMETYLSVLHALGILRDAVNAIDPYESDLGRARADQILPKRVRP